MSRFWNAVGALAAAIVTGLLLASPILLHMGGV